MSRERWGAGKHNVRGKKFRRTYCKDFPLAALFRTAGKTAVRRQVTSTCKLGGVEVHRGKLGTLRPQNPAPVNNNSERPDNNYRKTPDAIISRCLMDKINIATKPSAWHYGHMNLKPFESGVLCFVVLRKYCGKGKPVLIMHEAKSDSYGYGAFRTWTTQVGATIDRNAAAAALGAAGGASKSPAKIEAARRNGKRPKRA